MCRFDVAERLVYNTTTGRNQFILRNSVPGYILALKDLLSSFISVTSLLFFFFQAEDGIRDKLVTGVQTCALPIWRFSRALQALGESERDLYPPELAERLKSARESPMVEGDDVTFIYRGDAKHVEVVGDFTGWSLSGLSLRDVPGANLKFIRLKFPKGARLEYKFIADGEWILDPLNPNKNNNGVGGLNSNFAMPDYRPTPYAAGRDDLRGRLERLVLPGDDKRKVQVYLPPGYAEGGARYPVLYMQDGTQFIELGRAAEVADRMISEGKLDPFIIVFIDPIERNKEYWANDQFADWMAQTLVPFVDSRFSTRDARHARALPAASLGGVISVWTALRHPDLSARVGGQSSALQIDADRVVTALAKLDDDARRKFPTRFYFDAGQFEPPIPDIGRRVNVMLR